MTTFSGSTSIGSITSGSTSIGSITSGSTSIGSNTSGSTSIGSNTSVSTSIGSITSCSTSIGINTSGSTSIGSNTSGSTSIGSNTSGSTSLVVILANFIDCKSGIHQIWQRVEFQLKFQTIAEEKRRKVLHKNPNFKFVSKAGKILVAHQKARQITRVYTLMNGNFR